ncbi:GSCOCG00009696001-RA-CDS [Cotesia congregata]|uniref:Protein phosphatase 1 regulatory subunit n=1 Tax=Cotesia congregata TaxID=51543 RepID=A0A8J2ECQ7_COTCN|nr:GSCOCG00009696001-RA-CDS [Cotesia congregata]CAG5074945.1 Similar to PPP1R3C: Protein phosphatase 1 regulatory subunit 3C (Homo sapiens) [Cotesia congregata]
MCSIAMPAELILGHSPPVYGHHHFLYNPLMVTASPGNGIRPCITSTIDQLSGLTINHFNKQPKNDSEDIRKGNDKQKKRVVFADDRGRPLTQVRVMSEPSNMPPSFYPTGYLSKAIRDQAEATTNPWIAHFQQPASDYLAFRQKLDQNSVCLENVIIREAEECLDGTIKVKNVAYDKEVLVRTSRDNWKSHEDVYCTFVQQMGANAIQPKFILYDTFKFRVTLPANADKIEFCVCYRVNGQEFWDNNDEKNYVVKKRPECRRYSLFSQMDAKIPSNVLNTVEVNNGDNTIGSGKPSEAVRANILTWSEFASWQHLNNDAPYW